MSHTTPATTCPECEGRLQTKGGETLCGTRGLVLAEDHLDRGPEWRSFRAATHGSSNILSAPRGMG